MIHFPAAPVLPPEERVHPLFPASQAFLWLPALSGDALPFCTYNGGNGNRHPYRQGCGADVTEDGNGAPFSPPYPISPRTFVALNAAVTPPVSYHAIAIRRTLCTAEMERVGRRVMSLINAGGRQPAPLQLLKSDHKFYILAALSQMGLLCGTIQDQR